MNMRDQKTDLMGGCRMPFLPDWTSDGLVLYLAASLYFYLPLSMPLRYAIHKFVDPSAGWAMLAYPETWAILVLGALTLHNDGWSRLRTVPRKDPWFFAIVLCAAAYMIVLSTSALVQGSDPTFAFRKIGMEWILPLVLGISLRLNWSRQLDCLIARSLIGGTFVLFLVGLVTYYASFGIPSTFREHIFVNRTYLIWKGMAGGISFSEIPMGGVNVLAGHVATVCCLVVAAITLRASGATKLYFIFWMFLACIVEFLCYSRGVLIYFLLIAPIFFALHPAFRKGVWCRALQAMMLVFTAAIFLPSGSLSYWAGQLTVSDGSTARSRLAQVRNLLEVPEVSDEEVPAEQRRRIEEWLRNEYGSPVGNSAPPASPLQDQGRTAVEDASFKDPAPTLAGTLPKADVVAQEPAQDNVDTTGPSADLAEEQQENLDMKIRARIGGRLRRFLIGYGPGHYGILRGLVPDSGTHNTFLNAFVDCGIFGFLAFSLFLALASLRRFASWIHAKRNLSAGAQAQELGRLAALCSIIFIGILVDYRLENLGTMTGAALLWYLASAPLSWTSRSMPRRGSSEQFQQRPSAAAGEAFLHSATSPRISKALSLGGASDQNA